MSNWKREQFLCDGCGQLHDANHMSIQDPRSTGGGCTAGGGELWVDMETLQEYCTGCKKWLTLESGTFFCSCGHVMKPRYQDAALVRQAQTGVVVANGQAAYAVTHTDIAVVGQRQFTNVFVR